MSYKLYDFQDPELDEQVRLICDVLYNHRENYPGQVGVAPSGDANRRQLAGGTLGDRWHVPYQKGWEVASTSVTLNVLYAMPFFSGNASQITAIGLFQAISATVSYRIGIYLPTSAGDQYPGSLVTELGIIAFTSAGAIFKSTNVTFTIRPNSFYLLALVGNATATLGSTSTANMIPVFGHQGASNPSFRASQHITRAFTYGALPDPWGAGGTLGVGDVVSPVPNIYLRLA